MGEWHREQSSLRRQYERCGGGASGGGWSPSEVWLSSDRRLGELTEKLRTACRVPVSYYGTSPSEGTHSRRSWSWRNCRSRRVRETRPVRDHDLSSYSTPSWIASHVAW